MRVLYLINFFTPGHPGAEATGARLAPILLPGDCLTCQLAADDACDVGYAERALVMSTAVLPAAAAVGAGSEEAGVW